MSTGFRERSRDVRARSDVSVSRRNSG